MSLFQSSGTFKGNTHEFQVQRNNQILPVTLKGFFSGNDKIQIYKPADIASGDWLLLESEKYFVKSIQQLPRSIIIRYISEFDYKQTFNIPQQINIGTIAGNAIVGSQQNATLNINTGLEDLQRIISEKSSADKALLESLHNELEAIIKENKPLNKGSLSRFITVLDKYSDVAGAVGNIITKFLSCAS